VEESLKIQLTKKEETCHMLKLEIFNLKRMIEKTNKIVNFQSSSAIIDNIWNSQRSIDDKTMTSGAPFTNMRKDHPSQKEKVQLQSNYKS
jgi:hypothetical protein